MAYRRGKEGKRGNPPPQNRKLVLSFCAKRRGEMYAQLNSARLPFEQKKKRQHAAAKKKKKARLRQKK